MTNVPTFTAISEEKYWDSRFMADKSIERVKHFEGRTLAVKVLCGLELWRARDSLGHSAWYPYLMKCGISPPTASRRKMLAEEFLVWAGIIKAGVSTLQGVKLGLELITAKPFILNDFADYKLTLRDDAFVNTFISSGGGSAGGRSVTRRRSLTEKRIGFNTGPVFTGLKSIRECHDKWSATSRLEVKENLQVLKQFIEVVIDELSDYDEHKKQLN